jgi:flagellar secretion chaperone FliS
MYDQTAAYRSTQVVTSSPVAQVVLLYEGAIRFASQSVAHIERHEPEAAHNTSLRAQAIVSALRESLDLSAGDIASRLDALYEFILARLVDGNVSKTPAPTREAIATLRGLLDAWRSINEPPPAGAAAAPIPVARAMTRAFGAPVLTAIHHSGLPGAA